jgi:peptidoglycan/xylan/chitin deacetylase (PgdA/CDA1 family)
MTTRSFTASAIPYRWGLMGAGKRPGWLWWTALTALVLFGVPPAGAAGASVFAPGQTVVSLTFDDGLADQYLARAPLQSHGMRATFYVNSGTVDKPLHLTRAKLAELAGDGDEIAGHTVDHVDLAATSGEDLRHQVCDDRTALMRLGFPVADFAYPLGSHNQAAEKVVADCGYRSARAVGGLVSGSVCSACPAAERIPPRFPYVIATNDSVGTTTSLADLEGYVTQAEGHGGGWVPLVIHHLCDRCDPVYSLNPSTFTAFLDWLSARRSSGTVVATVAEVLDPALNPPAPSSPAPGAGGAAVARAAHQRAVSGVVGAVAGAGALVLAGVALVRRRRNRARLR